MAACLILGDSIAAGVGNARPECRTQAVIGITSAGFLMMPLSERMADTIVISLGANDTDASVTAASIEKLRNTVTAGTVYWLLSAGPPPMREAVRQVAARFRDRIIDVAPLAGRDGIHPDRAGYQALAESIRSGDSPNASAGDTAYRDFPPPYSVYRAMPPPTVATASLPVVVMRNGQNNLAGPARSTRIGPHKAGVSKGGDVVQSCGGQPERCGIVP
jgi:hypothetical protein